MEKILDRREEVGVVWEVGSGLGDCSEGFVVLGSAIFGGVEEV